MSSTELRASHPRQGLGRFASRPSDPGDAGRDPAGEHRRVLLSSGDPREVLARISDGDPLGLRARIAEALRVRCLLLDADRVHLRALALCAREAPRYRGRPALDAWLGDQVERALEERLAEEARLLGEPAPARSDPAGAFAHFAIPLGLAPEEVRRGCARFNRLPQESRAAFFALVLERGSLDELARGGDAGATELARRARRALLALLGAQVGAGQPEGVPPDHPHAAAPGPAPTSSRTEGLRPRMDSDDRSGGSTP